MDPLSIYDHLPSRKNPRLEDYDYRQPGGYFVTVCAIGMANLFGSVHNGIAYPSEYGRIVQFEWFNTSKIRPYVLLNDYEFILMPNHIHGIIWITEENNSIIQNNSGKSGPRSKSLGAIIGQFKSSTTRRINNLRKSPGASVWQRNYYDHIIRNDKDLREIQNYILKNPRKWEDDRKGVHSHK